MDVTQFYVVNISLDIQVITFKLSFACVGNPVKKSKFVNCILATQQNTLDEKYLTFLYHMSVFVAKYNKVGLWVYGILGCDAVRDVTFPENLNRGENRGNRDETGKNWGKQTLDFQQ
jgi:hypothetical protein